MARSFNGSSDRLNVAAGAVTSLSSFTMVVVLRVTTTGDFQIPFCHFNGSNGAGFYFEYPVFYYLNNGSAAVPVSSINIATSQGWMMLAITKSAGTTAARLHRYKYSDATLVSSNTSGTFANPTGTMTQARFGHQNSSFYFGGDIAAAATFDYAMTDAQIAALPYSLAHWLACAPKAMWVLDQAATSQPVLDWSGGGANQASINGTSVATNSVPIFGYGHPILLATTGGAGGGGGGSAQGVLAGTLPALTADLAGQTAATAVVDATLPALTGAAAGSASTTGAVAATLPALSGSVTGSASTTAAVAGALPALSGSLAGQASATGVLSCTLPGLTAAFTADGSAAAAVDGSLPALTAAFALQVPARVVLTVTLPALTAALAGTAASPDNVPARSSVAVSARRESSAAVSARRGSAAAVSARYSSTPTVSGG